MIRIPALSLWRPWPSLILSHGKNIENRHWFTSHRGPLWIHAAKPWTDLDSDWLFERGVVDPNAQLAPWTAEHPKGIVGLVDVVGMCHPSRDQPCQCGPWAMPGAVHWQLANPHPLAEPVPCNGRQGLWYPVGDLAEALATALPCDLCHEDQGLWVRGPHRLCTECRGWKDYWDGLTPEERAAEQRSMDAYVGETTNA